MNAGANAINIPANVAIIPIIIPIIGLASVSLPIKSVIANATSKTTDANGAIATPTLIRILMILPNNWISLGPFS